MGKVGSMNKDVFYQVVQDGTSVGYFREKSNALSYLEQFNTKVEVSPLKIIERHFLDEDLKNELGDNLGDSFYDGGINWDAWK